MKRRENRSLSDGNNQIIAKNQGLTCCSLLSHLYTSLHERMGPEIYEWGSHLFAVCLCLLSPMGPDSVSWHTVCFNDHMDKIQTGGLPMANPQSHQLSCINGLFSHGGPKRRGLSSPHYPRLSLLPMLAWISFLTAIEVKLEKTDVGSNHDGLDFCFIWVLQPKCLENTIVIDPLSRLRLILTCWPRFTFRSSIHIERSCWRGCSQVNHLLFYPTNASQIPFRSFSFFFWAVKMNLLKRDDIGGINNENIEENNKVKAQNATWLSHGTHIQTLLIPCFANLWFH